MTYDQHEKILAHTRYLKSGMNILLDILNEEVESVEQVKAKLSAAESEKYKRTPIVATDSYFEAAGQSRMCPSPLADPTVESTNVVNSSEQQVSAVMPMSPLTYVPAYEDHTTQQMYAQV